jgi:hypothetical protein
MCCCGTGLAIACAQAQAEADAAGTANIDLDQGASSIATLLIDERAARPRVFFPGVISRLLTWLIASTMPPAGRANNSQ